MAIVPLQAVSSPKLFWECKPGCFVGRRLGGADRQLNSVSVPSSGIRIGRRGVPRSLWVLEDFVPGGLCKENALVRAKRLEWREGRRSSSGSTVREVIRAVDGDFSNRDTAKDPSFEKFSGGNTSQGFFRDQVYDYDRGDDFYLDESTPEGGISEVNGKVGRVVRNEDLEERFHAWGDAEERRRGGRSRELAQLDNDRRLPETSASGTKDGAYNCNLDDAGYAREHVYTRARREEDSDVVDRPAELVFRECLEVSNEIMRSPYSGYERDSPSDPTFRASSELVPKLLGQAEELVGVDREEGREITENFPLERDLQGSKMNTITKEELWQRFSREQGLPSSPDSVSESRPLVEDTEKTSLILREARDYDGIYESRGSLPYELGALEEHRSPPAGDFDRRYDFQSNRQDEVSEIADDEERGELLSKSGSIGREMISNTMHGREVEQQESARGVLYAKQVISLATAQSLGFVTQLWVDVENLKVVALEVRPSLLFGDFYSFPLKSLSKVGDVILIQDDDNILEGWDQFNCSDLVGNDLFTEDGINLGKVRDYNFSLEDGAVLSLQFDAFGVPLIPSNLIKTYSLTVDEVIESQQDSFLVRRGAEKRVQTLSKGFLSRSRKTSLGRQALRTQQSNQAPEIQYLGQTSERVRGVAESDNYTPAYTTSRLQPKRVNTYSDGKRGYVKESLRANRYESQQTNDLYPSNNFSARSKGVTPEEFEDYQTRPSIRRDVPVRDGPEISENEQTQGPDFGMSPPDVGRNGRGLPMSYRTSRRRIEN